MFGRSGVRPLLAADGDAMDGAAFAQVLDFEVRLELLVLDTEIRVDEFDLLQQRVGTQERRDDRKVLGMVGLHSPAGAGFQARGRGVDEGRLEEPPLMVPRFRPRVGVVDVQSAERSARALDADEVRGIRANDANVRNAAALHAIDGVLKELVSPFDAEEVDLWVRLRAAEQKAGLAAADLEFDRVLIAENPIPVAVFEFSELDGDRERFRERLRGLHVRNSQVIHRRSTCSRRDIGRNPYRRNASDVFQSTRADSKHAIERACNRAAWWAARGGGVLDALSA